MASTQPAAKESSTSLNLREIMGSRFEESFDLLFLATTAPILPRIPIVAVAAPLEPYSTPIHLQIPAGPLQLPGVGGFRFGRRGIVLCWISVGCVKPNFFTVDNSSWLKPKFSNVLIFNLPRFYKHSSEKAKCSLLMIKCSLVVSNALFLFGRQ